MFTSDPIDAGKVHLRRLTTDDADDVAVACADPVTQRFLPQLPSPYTRDDALWWINEGAPAAFAEGGGVYAISDPQTGRLLGGIGCHGRHGGTKEIGYWVAPWARIGGIATTATRALTNYAFSQGVRRLILRIEPENGPSQRVAIGAGFSREGIERGGGQDRDGSRYDLTVWARLDSDPDEPTVRLLPDLPGRGRGNPGELTDGVVTVRPLTEADAADTLAVRSLADVIATSVTSVPPELDAITRVCARSEANWLAGARANFTIRDAASDAYAGEIGLYYWEPPTQQAMIGYSMLPAWRGKGYATRAARLVAQWSFEQVGIARLIAGTAPDNVGSQRVLERAGFVREGYQRSRLPGPNGTRIDDILFALLPDQLGSGS